MSSDVFLVLIIGAFVSGLSHLFRLPNAVAQVVLGVLLGSAVLGWVEHGPLLHTLGEAAVVLLLGAIGLELGIERLKRGGWAGLAVALFGIVLSLAGGYSLGQLYGSPSPEALYIGLALAATSIGITVQVMQQFGLLSRQVAEIVIAAAIIDDVIALYLLGAAHGFLSGGLTGIRVAGFVILAVVVLGGLYGISRVLTRWMSRHRIFENPWLRSAWILIAIVIGALSTQALELSTVVGGFFAGVGVGDGLERTIRNHSVKTLEPLVLAAMPFFFVMIGVQARWEVLSEPGMILLVTGLVVMAVIAKVAGGLLGAIGTRWNERWLIASGMVPRGEIALVIATLGFEQGHITHHVFVALVLMTIVLSILGPLLMMPLAKRLGSELLLERHDKSSSGVSESRQIKLHCP